EALLMDGGLRLELLLESVLGPGRGRLSAGLGLSFNLGDTLGSELGLGGLFGLGLRLGRFDASHASKLNAFYLALGASFGQDSSVRSPGAADLGDGGDAGLAVGRGGHDLGRSGFGPGLGGA